MKLFCLPYAGGGASAFRCMKEMMPAHIQLHPLHLAGREHRFSEPLEKNLAIVVRQLAQQLTVNGNEPYALYGHSMGSLLGFELIRYLVRNKLPLPVHFFAAARGAPALSGEYQRFSRFSDIDFIQHIKAFGGLPEKILANEEIMAMVLPILRNDFDLLDDYQYFEGDPLPVPITTFHGENDSTVRLSWVLAWRYETSREYYHHKIEGNHFFLNVPGSRLFNLISDTLYNYQSTAVINLATPCH
jgi:medium-chain acyl-[acyl-carrier-protein] hydrolase